MPVEGLTLFFDAGERDAVELLRRACEKSTRLIHDCWGLATPSDCRVSLMTSWPHFVFHSAPWSWRILLGATMPLWYWRARNLWKYAGGWAQRYGKRRAVGVKPPRLIQAADRSIGERIFVKNEDMGEKVQHVTCHELVHAFTAHLKLPMWLNEGLAMLTVDRYAGKPTVRPETLETLARAPQGTGPGRYRKLRVRDRDGMVYHVVRGYWLTRYIEDTRPGWLKGILERRYRHKTLESKVASAYGMEDTQFWHDVDGMVVSHFKVIAQSVF
jgi:hypothetical protein